MPKIQAIDIANDGYITVTGDGLPAKLRVIGSLDYAPIFTAGITITGGTLAITVPATITKTGATAQHIGCTATTTASVGYTGWALGFFGTTTLSATAGNVTYNAAGGVFEVNFASAYAANQAGLVCGAYVGAYSASTNGAARPTTALWIETIPGTSVDFTNVPLISFITSGAGTKSAIMFELGNNSAGKTVTTTSGGMFYHQTIHIIANNTAHYIPVSTVEGTYTTVYPIVSTYAGGIGVSTAFSTGTSGYSGVRNVSTFTATGAAVHKGIQSDVTHNATGYGTAIGVAGKVNLAGDFTGGAGYCWGVQGQMNFNNGCTINNEGSVWAGGRFVLTEESKDGWTHTDGHLCVVLIDSLLQTSVTLSTGQKSLLRIGNWGGSSNFCTFDSTFHVYGRHTDHLFYFFDCDAADSFITSEASNPSGDWTHKIKVYLNNGSLTKYIMLCDDPS